ncbi:magnesium transporter MRS2-1-like protein [Tanacetum coccineum]
MADLKECLLPPRPASAANLKDISYRPSASGRQPFQGVDVPSLKKRGQGLRSWIRVDAAMGDSQVIEVDRFTIIRRCDLPTRDLRLLDPLFVYPSTILGREKAIVVNLEQIRCIITTDEVFSDEMEIFDEIKVYLGETEDSDVKHIAPFPLLEKNAVEFLRYRAELKAYFQENPRDLDVLKHDKLLSKKAPATHLREVPEYLLDNDSQASKFVKLTRVVMGITNNNNKGDLGEEFSIIKTENEEMVNEDVTIPIGDQGLIKDLDKSLGDELDSFDALFCRKCGTVNYMAPELLLGSRHYSMAVDMVLLRKTLGFDSVASVVKLHRSTSSFNKRRIFYLEDGTVNYMAPELLHFHVKPESKYTMLLNEYMSNVSLDELLHEKNKCDSFVGDWVTWYKISLGVAQGICYLHHNYDPVVVHRDLMPRNILLDGDMEARVADFGVAKLTHCDESLLVIAGPYG